MPNPAPSYFEVYMSPRPAARMWRGLRGEWYAMSATRGMYRRPHPLGGASEPFPERKNDPTGKYYQTVTYDELLAIIASTRAAAALDPGNSHEVVITYMPIWSDPETIKNALATIDTTRDHA